MEEEKEVEAPLPPWHYRLGVRKVPPEAEDRAEREEEERRQREAMTEAWRKLQTSLPPLAGE